MSILHPDHPRVHDPAELSILDMFCRQRNLDPAREREAIARREREDLIRWRAAAVRAADQREPRRVA
jgi:hypothetical protein